MMTQQKRLVSALILATLLAGCASCPPPVSVDIPPRPELLPVTAEVWQRVPLEAQDVWTHNDLALKRYAKQLEARLEAVQPPVR